MVGAVAAAWYALDVVLMLFAGVLVGVFLDALASPLVRRLHLPRWAAVLLVLVVLCVAFAAAWKILAPSVSQQLKELEEQLPRIVERLRDEARGIPGLNPVYESARSTLPENSMGRVLRMFSTASGALAAVFVAFFTGIYLAIDPVAYRAGAVELFPRGQRRRAERLLADLGGTLRWWLLAKIGSMAVVAVLTWIALTALGLPLALALALLAGLLAFIPNIGPVLAAAPAILVGLADGPARAASVAAAYVAVQMIETYAVTPVLQRRAVDLPPAVSLAAQALMAVWAGGPGMLLAAPLAACLMRVRRAFTEELPTETGT